MCGVSEKRRDGYTRRIERTKDDKDVGMLVVGRQR